MIVHVLNGDALKNQLPADIEPYIVMRECMIEGPHNSEDTKIFWENRCKYFIKSFQTTKERYNQLVVTELNKLKTIEAGSEICLWFEYDLFCQTNMWYVISRLKNKFEDFIIRWVQPDHLQWTGFGTMSPERLAEAFKNRIDLSISDIDRLDSFWHHYVQRDMQFFKNQNLEKETSISFIADSIDALVKLYPKDGESLPIVFLRKIISKNPEAAFGKIFCDFSKKAGVYGYGDLQVRNLIKNLGQS